MVVLGLLALDLKVFHRNAHVVTNKEAAVWSVVWIVLAFLFNVGIYFLSGSERAMVLSDVYKIPIGISFIVISSILGVAIVASLLYPQKKRE